MMMYDIDEHRHSVLVVDEVATENIPANLCAHRAQYCYISSGSRRRSRLCIDVACIKVQLRENDQSTCQGDEIRNNNPCRGH